MKEDLLNLKDGTEVYCVRLYGGYDTLIKAESWLIPETGAHRIEINSIGGTINFYYIDKSSVIKDSIERLKNEIECQEKELAELEGVTREHDLMWWD